MLLPKMCHSSLVSLFQDDLPSWTLSAMKCLANWVPPEKRQRACSSSIPSYPGFENDVFEVVKDYFVTLLHRNGPLTTYRPGFIFEQIYFWTQPSTIHEMSRIFSGTERISTSSDDGDVIFYRIVLEEKRDFWLYGAPFSPSKSPK